MTFTTVTYWLNGTEHTVPAWPTDNPHLVIVPYLDSFGCVVDGWYLLHKPTGMRCGTDRSCYELRRIASILARDGLDYSSSDRAHYNSETHEYRAAYVAAVREVEGVEPSPEDEPTTRASGFKPGGIPRQALPLIADSLEHFQEAYNKSVIEPVTSPDGTPNLEWRIQVDRQTYTYAVAYLLAVLHRCDSYMADQVAASLADDWAEVDLVETVYEWRRELAAGKPLTLHGVPTPVSGELLSEVSE
jgi:hypothetical protein